MKKIKLNNGLSIPLQGFGVFQITDYNLCKESVINALNTGYRLIDTAACYDNEKVVGEAIKESNIKREDIFISSKVWIQDAGYEKTIKSFEKTLENLQTSYLDIYLIHMPYGDYHGSWRAMEELYQAGKIKAIGVCNFLPDRLLDLVLSHNIIPSINQIELHPFCQQKETCEIMKKYDIKPMAWAPFAEGRRKIFQNESLNQIGAVYQKTSAQVILRWLYQNEIIAIPKSVHLNRIQENYNICDFSLNKMNIDKISDMDLESSLILNICDLEEIRRLYNIQFIQ